MSDETQCAERLCRILEREEALYVELRSVLQRERECIVHLEAEDLELIVREKLALGDEGRMLEEARMGVSRELAESLGLASERLTLSQICDAMKGGAPALRAAHTRLVALLGAVRELLEANREFATDATRQVRGALRVLGRMLPPEAVYRPLEVGAGDSRESGLHASRPGRLVRRTA